MPQAGRRLGLGLALRGVPALFRDGKTEAHEARRKDSSREAGERQRRSSRQSLRHKEDDPRKKNEARDCLDREERGARAPFCPYVL